MGAAACSPSPPCKEEAWTARSTSRASPSRRMTTLQRPSKTNRAHTFLPRSTPRTEIVAIASSFSISGEPRRRKRGRPSIKDGAQAMGRSRGGLTTRSMRSSTPSAIPFEVMLSPGQDHDLTCAEALIEAVDPGALIADKAFDAEPLHRRPRRSSHHASHPAQVQPKDSAPVRFRLYCERNLIERFFDELKHFQAIPTPTTSSPKTFLAEVHLRRHPPQLKTGPSHSRAAPAIVPSFATLSGTPTTILAARCAGASAQTRGLLAAILPRARKSPETIGCPSIRRPSRSTRLGSQSASVSAAAATSTGGEVPRRVPEGF